MFIRNFSAHLNLRVFYLSKIFAVKNVIIDGDSDVAMFRLGLNWAQERCRARIGKTYDNIKSFLWPVVILILSSSNDALVFDL